MLKNSKVISILLKHIACSRRDDIISMMYVLIFLLNHTLPWIDKVKENSLKLKFKKVLGFKLSKPKEIAIGNACNFSLLIFE